MQTLHRFALHIILRILRDELHVALRKLIFWGRLFDDYLFGHRASLSVGNEEIDAMVAV